MGETTVAIIESLMPISSPVAEANAVVGNANTQEDSCAKSSYRSAMTILVLHAETRRSSSIANIKHRHHGTKMRNV